MESEIYAKMQKSIREYDTDAAVAAANEAVQAGLDIPQAIENGFANVIREIGEAFERMDIFLPELVMAADAMKSGVAVMEKALKESGGEIKKKAVVVLGTVEGDIHDIGKTVVGAMLQANGYVVQDLGVEVPAPRFIQAAQEVNADVIAMSALLSTTMLYQRDVIELLRNKGLQGKYKVMVGGAPVTQKWADEIGADLYARDAVQAVRTLEKALGGQ
jgi:corrinoid protein of di/trimethylamine methyltransferase